MNILIVEDEVIAANYLKEIILEAGYKVVGIVGTGREAIESAYTQKPDLILMDIMLNDAISGIDAAIEIKYKQNNILIAFVTSYSDKEMLEAAIEAQADGYFIKPYNKNEIFANLKIIHAKIDKSTHSISHNPHTLMLVNDYRYHYATKQLYHGEEKIYLSTKEQKVIDYFCRNAHSLLDFETTIEHIWGDSMPQQTLRSLIYRIREKTCQELIINISKVGYKIATQD